MSHNGRGVAGKCRGLTAVHRRQEQSEVTDHDGGIQGRTQVQTLHARVIILGPIRRIVMPACQAPELSLRSYGLEPQVMRPCSPRLDTIMTVGGGDHTHTTPSRAPLEGIPSCPTHARRELSRRPRLLGLSARDNPTRLRSNGGARPEMVIRSCVAWTSVCVNPTQARNGDMAVGEPARPRI